MRASEQAARVVACSSIISRQCGTVYLPGRDIPPPPPIETEHSEEEHLPDLPFEPGTAEAGSTVTVSVSHARYFGDDKWDKVPYTVKVTTHVLFACPPEFVADAEEVAFSYARARALSRLTQVVPALLETIEQDLYPGLFE